MHARENLGEGNLAGLDQQSSAWILASLGIHALLLSKRMRDQLGVAPADQCFGGRVGAMRIAQCRRVEQDLYLSCQSPGQLSVMILDGFDSLGVCGAGCDDDCAHANSSDST